MKTTTFALIFLLTGLNLWAQPTPTARPAPGRAHTTATPAATTGSVPGQPTSGDPSATMPGAATDSSEADTTESTQPEEMIPAGNINFQGVDVSQVLEVYAKLVGRTLLRAGLPTASIVLKTETPLTKSEAIQALQAVLSLNGIQVINIGDKFVKVLPADQAGTAAPEFNDLPANKLPALGAYVTHIVQLKNIKPSEMVPIITPFSKLPNSILPIDSNGILVLRDNAENVKRMLQMIDRVDISVPAEYISEVVPIKYALAEDIASALNSLGGSGSGSTVSIGGSSGSSGRARTTSNTTGSTTGMGGMGGYNNNQTGGLNSPQSRTGTTANGTPGASPFQQRLQSIIQRASGAGGQQDQIQVFGQTKIIADQRSNSLLIFATRQDMVAITNIIDKLDVLLSQVLIESVIMEVSLGHDMSFGVSAVQRQQAFSGSVTNTFIGTGAYNNGQPFWDFVNKGLVNNGTNSSFPGGLSYFGSIAGSDYDVAVQAAASDNSITIVQKPRIQTFQAQEATFFVGSTVPYVTSTYNGGTTGIGSSYSQLSVGVSLGVTPFINPDGLVVMQIDEEIDNISGYTTIDGNPVPNTSKKTLSSNVAVKDRDSIILGGAISSQKSSNRNGVPLLQDIPLLGALFSARSSSKTRDELLVLMRPTVLRTPELAAAQAKIEESRLPGIHHAEALDTKDEQKQIEAENRADAIQDRKDAKRNKTTSSSTYPADAPASADMPENAPAN